VVEEKQAANHRFDRVIARALAQAQRQGVTLTPGHAVPSLVEFIERGRFDLLVIGYMGHSAIYNRLIGGTTDRLVELAPCAVHVAK
jgi:nucleotide-binding universal stress UspA family protein